jgi:hypothetical protein
MTIDQLKPRYYLEVRASTRADPKWYSYQILENLDLPWPVRDSQSYATEGEARRAGEDALRYFLEGATA